jgi:hypothetical protein
MRTILQIVSFAALVATIVPPVLFLTGRLSLDQTKWTMLAATLVWFAVTPLWMGRPKMDEELVI